MATVTVTQVYLNNSNVPTTVSRTVNAVVVDNQLVADIREIRPGVVNSAYTEIPLPY